MGKGNREHEGWNGRGFLFKQSGWKRLDEKPMFKCRLEGGARGKWKGPKVGAYLVSSRHSKEVRMAGMNSER